MAATAELPPREREALPPARALADRAFSRAAGAPLIEGNRVRLLIDARENYPAWLEAIRAAKRHVHFENYIIHEDAAGQMFAEALIAKARQGIRVRLVHDWLGGFGRTSRGFWNRLRAGGVEVRCYNPPRWDSPLGWVSRDHRKTISVDGEVGFVTGLCVGEMWLGDPGRKLDPWRDSGVEVRGPAVAEIERAFAEVWALTGDPIPGRELASRDASGQAGDTALRVVASMPATAGLFRVDQLVAALARSRLWLTDAYYAGTAPYLQALRAAVRDGVDVRLLVPGATDIPLLKPLSRAGYRPLLEAGVRVFEWNGTMLHAKTAVADSRWARVGSTNLNISSWLGNCEMDLVVEDEPFARLLEGRYLEDLENATEVVLDARHKLRAPQPSRPRSLVLTRGQGSGGRAAAGAIRVGHAIGAAFTNRRVLEPVEARVMLTGGLGLLALAIVVVLFPRLLAYPFALVLAWVSSALFYRSYRLHRAKTRPETGALPTSESASSLRPETISSPEAPRDKGG
jgi:cardiolipin synthase A/B